MKRRPLATACRRLYVHGHRARGWSLSVSSRPEVALGLREQVVERVGRLDRPAHHARAVALEPITISWMSPARDDDDEVVGAGRDGPRVESEALAHELARVDLDPRRTARATEMLGRDLRVLPEELADRRLGPAEPGHGPGDHAGKHEN